MQFSNPKIKFYKIRTFGEKFNVSFDFLRETWKPLLKFSLYVILPICLVQSFAITAYMRFFFLVGAQDFYYGSSNTGMILSGIINCGLYVLCVLVCYLL